MSIDSQISRFETSVQDFIECISAQREESFLVNIARWAPRDIVAHLVGWNRQVIDGSKEIMKGELPFYDRDPGENYSKVSAALIRRYSSRDRDELLGELRASAKELEEFLRSLDVGEWERDFGVRHKGEVLTIQSTVDDLIDDYAHHTRQMEAWAGSS